MLIFGALLCLAASADPSERLSDPAAEARARGIFRETRCLVCQGQSIDDSDADLAHDLRQVIRGQIAAGRSPGEVRAFLKSRYGDYVLLRPPLSATTALLWGGPFAVGLFGLGLLIARQRRPASAPAPLSPEEAERLAALESPPNCLPPNGKVT